MDCPTDPISYRISITKTRIFRIVENCYFLEESRIFSILNKAFMNFSGDCQINIAPRET